jgi:hypothetical protein
MGDNRGGEVGFSPGKKGKEVTIPSFVLGVEMGKDELIQTQ